MAFQHGRGILAPLKLLGTFWYAVQLLSQLKLKLHVY